MTTPTHTIMAALLWAAGTALAEPVVMPSPAGDQSFDDQAFAYDMLVPPSGQFACFTASALSDCTPESLQAAILGFDLIHGLSLGIGGDITVGFATTGSMLGIWEAGNIGSTIDTLHPLVSVHSDQGWSVELAYGSEKISPVLPNAQPSGYPTNFSIFFSQDFGLMPGVTFDAVRIRSCCSNNAHLDLLAIAIIPEPSSLHLMGLGLGFGLLLMMSARQQRRRNPWGSPRLGGSVAPA